jgi:hypothetical protein
VSLSPVPTIRTIDDGRKTHIDPIWMAWFNSIQFWLFPIGQFGTTANRPTTSLYIGRRYYDTTLGYPVWVHQITPTIIWHNGAGASV